MTKTLPWPTAHVARPLDERLLQLAAAVLRGASALLERAAVQRESRRMAASFTHANVEFHLIHGEGGAPEGALYVDGVLYGTLPGVTRW